MTEVQVLVKIVREQILPRQNALFLEVLTILQKQIQKYKKGNGESLCGCGSEKLRTERTPRKCFRCGSEDKIIDECPKPPKDNKKKRRQFHFIERGNSA